MPCGGRVLAWCSSFKWPIGPPHSTSTPVTRPSNSRPSSDQRLFKREHAPAMAACRPRRARWAAKHSAPCSRLPAMTSNITIAPLLRQVIGNHWVCPVERTAAGRHVHGPSRRFCSSVTWVQTPRLAGDPIAHAELRIRRAHGCLLALRALHHIGALAQTADLLSPLPGKQADARTDQGAQRTAGGATYQHAAKPAIQRTYAVIGGFLDHFVGLCGGRAPQRLPPG